MPHDPLPTADVQTLAARVRRLAEAFGESDLVRLRIEEANEDAIELHRAPSPATAPARRADPGAALEAPAAHGAVEAIKADLVGIVRLTRPLPVEGESIEGDRDLAYVEALGIRTPVRSLGGGRLVSIRCHDGDPVEYGQTLFEIDRG